MSSALPLSALHSVIGLEKIECLTGQCGTNTSQILENENGKAISTPMRRIFGSEVPEAVWIHQLHFPFYAG